MILGRGSIGWFGEGAVDWVSDRVSDAASFLSDAFGEIPLSGELADLVKGPLREWANGEIGKTVLRAMSTVLYGSIAWSLGPQLASVAFAVPGLFRGQPFEEAWFDEVKWRTEKTAEILGPAAVDIIGEQLSRTLTKLADDVGAGNLVQMGIAELARRYNIRDDVAKLVIEIWNKVQLPDLDFDPQTGKIRAATGTSAFDPAKLFTSVVGRAATAAVVGQSRGGVQQAVTVLDRYGRVLPTTPIAIASSGGGSSPAPRERHDLMLAAVIVAAAGAFAWWHQKHGKGTR